MRDYDAFAVRFYELPDGRRVLVAVSDPEIAGKAAIALERRGAVRLNLCTNAARGVVAECLATEVTELDLDPHDPAELDLILGHLHREADERPDRAALVGALRDLIDVIDGRARRALTDAEDAELVARARAVYTGAVTTKRGG